MRYVYCGNRMISVEVMKVLIKAKQKPLAVFVPEKVETNVINFFQNMEELKDIKIIKGNHINDPNILKELESMNLDYIISIHYPVIFRKPILELPKIGVLNLHPAYLPFNKGWHTPSWAIVEGTPYGASLHFMSEKLDEGDLIARKELDVKFEETADELYQRVLQLEVELFEESLDNILTLNPTRIVQLGEGTSHKRADLASLQKLELNESYQLNELLKRLKGLTTNNFKEACYVRHDDKNYYLQIKIIDET